MRFILLFMALFCAAPVWAIPTMKAEFLERAPKARSKAEMGKLVDYLIKPYKKEEDQAFAMLAWIANYVDYDDFAYERIDKNNHSHRDLSRKIPEKGDILKTRLGVCEDIVDLYIAMLKKADIPAKKIGGCITNNQKWKAGDKCDAPHAWMAIWLDKQWELVDPTFAMGKASAMSDIRTNAKYKREVKKRERRSSDAYEFRDRRLVPKWFKAGVDLMEDEHQPENAVWKLTKIRDRKNKNLK